MDFQERFRGKMSNVTRQGLLPLFSAPGNPIKKILVTSVTPKFAIDTDQEDNLYQNSPIYLLSELKVQYPEAPRYRAASSNHCARASIKPEYRASSKTAEGAMRPKHRLQSLTEDDGSNNGIPYQMNRDSPQLPDNVVNTIFNKELPPRPSHFRSGSACRPKQLDLNRRRISETGVERITTLVENKENKTRDCSSLFGTDKKSLIRPVLPKITKPIYVRKREEFGDHNNGKQGYFNRHSRMRSVDKDHCQQEISAPKGEMNYKRKILNQIQDIYNNQ